MQIQVSMSPQVSDIRLEHVLSMAGDGTKDFNCWGATQYVLQAKQSLGWIEVGEMTGWLEHNTVKVRDKQPGDILAVFVEHPMRPDIRLLIHTAVYLGNSRYLHKMGQNRAEVATLGGVMKTYGKYMGIPSISEIRRITCV